MTLIIAHSACVQRSPKRTKVTDRNSCAQHQATSDANVLETLSANLAPSLQRTCRATLQNQTLVTFKFHNSTYWPTVIVVGGVACPVLQIIQSSGAERLI